MEGVGLRCVCSDTSSKIISKCTPLKPSLHWEENLRKIRCLSHHIAPHIRLRLFDTTDYLEHGSDPSKPYFRFRLRRLDRTRLSRRKIDKEERAHQFESFSILRRWKEVYTLRILHQIWVVLDAYLRDRQPSSSHNRKWICHSALTALQPVKKMEYSEQGV